MKPVRTVLVTLVALGLASTLALQPASSQARSSRTASPAPAPSRVVLEVNGIKTTAAEFGAQLEREWNDFRAQNQVNLEENSPRLQDLKRRLALRLVEKMIERHVFLSAARRANIRVSADSVQSEWSQLVANYPTEADFDSALARVGRSRAELKARLQEELQIREFMRRNVEDPVVTETEAREFYTANRQRFAQPEMVHASHILVPDDTAAQTRLREIRSRLDRGESFAVLASQYSICPSKMNGGDLGMFGRGQMVPAFEQVAFSQPLGRVSDPVKTEFGWHLILVEERQNSRTPDFGEVRPRIEQAIMDRKSEEELQSLGMRLRLQSTVKVTGPLL